MSMTDLKKIKKEVNKILKSQTFGGAFATKRKVSNYLFPLTRDASIKNYVIKDSDPIENRDFTVEVIGLEKSYKFTVSGTKVTIE